MDMKVVWSGVLAVIIAAPGLVLTLPDGGFETTGWNAAFAEEAKMPNDNSKTTVKAKARASASATASANAGRKGDRCEASSQASAEAEAGGVRQVDRDQDHKVGEGDNCRAEASSSAKASAGGKGTD